MKKIFLILLIPLFSFSETHDTERKVRHEEEKENKVTEVKTLKELEKKLEADQKAGRLFLVDVWTPSCGACMLFKPNFLETVSKFPKDKVRFYTLNTQEVTEAKEKFPALPSVVWLTLDDKNMPQFSTWAPLEFDPTINKNRVLNWQQLAEKIKKHLKEIEEKKKY